MFTVAWIRMNSAFVSLWTTYRHVQNEEKGGRLMIMRKEGYFGSLHMDLRLCNWNWKLGWSYWNLGVAEPKSIVWSSWRNPGWWWWSSPANIADSLSSHASGFSQGTCPVCSRECQAPAGCSHPCCCCLCLANQSIVCSWANNKTHGVHTTKEKKWKGKEKKRNVKSELMNVCSSSWTVGRIDQLNGFLNLRSLGWKNKTYGFRQVCKFESSRR